MGAVQARILEERERENGGQPAPSSSMPAQQQRPVKVSDDVMLARLANEGWVERKGG